MKDHTTFAKGGSHAFRLLIWLWKSQALLPCSLLFSSPARAFQSHSGLGTWHHADPNTVYSRTQDSRSDGDGGSGRFWIRLRLVRPIQYPVLLRKASAGSDLLGKLMLLMLGSSVPTK